MNQVRASVMHGRRQDKAAARTARGLPARRRRPAPFPSGQLRDQWPSGAQRRATRPVTAQLLGAGHTAALTLAQRSQVPVGLRDFHPVTFRVPVIATGMRKPTVPAVEPAPPTAVVSAPVVEPEPAAVEPEPAAVAPEPEPAADAAEPEPAADAAEPEPVAVVAGPEPAVVAPEPEPEPEPGAASAAATADSSAARTRHADNRDDRLARSSRVLEATREVMLGGPDRAADLTPDTPLTEAWDDPAPERRRVSGRMIALAVVVVALVGGGAAAAVVAAGSGDSPRPAASTAAATGIPAALVTWVRTELGESPTLFTTDAVVTAGVTATGLTARTVTGTGDVPVDGVLVARLAGGATPTSDVEAVSATRALVPLAAFTAADGAYVVSRSVDKPAQQVEADRDASTSTAQAATSGLLANAAVTVSDAARPVLEAGTLDLRAAALLATVASGQAVTVVSAPQDAAEAAVGVPVRTVVVSVGDRAALDAVVQRARYPYAPTVSTPTDGTTGVRLTWSLLADPDLTVN